MSLQHGGRNRCRPGYQLLGRWCSRPGMDKPVSLARAALALPAISGRWEQQPGLAQPGSARRGRAADSAAGGLARRPGGAGGRAARRPPGK